LNFSIKSVFEKCKNSNNPIQEIDAMIEANDPSIPNVPKYQIVAPNAPMLNVVSVSAA